MVTVCEYISSNAFTIRLVVWVNDRNEHESSVNKKVCIKKVNSVEVDSLAK